MGSRGKPLFDLNELPCEDNEENNSVLRHQPQKALPSTSSQAAERLAVPATSQGISNNNAFSHAPSGSGFQPFVRPRSSHGPKGAGGQKVKDQNSLNSSSSKETNDDFKAARSLVSGTSDVSALEREEGEWSDAEGSADIQHGSHSSDKQDKVSQGQGAVKMMDPVVSGASTDGSSGADPDSNDVNGKTISRNVEANVKGDASMESQEEPNCAPKQREVKGIEASHAIKIANNPIKRKVDQQHEAKLGKKRNRQTMFLNLEDVKQAGPIKTSTPRRQTFSSTVTTRTVKEARTILPPTERFGEKQSQSVTKDGRQVDASSSEGGTTSESSELKSESNPDMSLGLLGRPRKLNGDNDTEALPPLPRQTSWKQPADSRQPKNLQGNNRKPAPIVQNPMDSKPVIKKLPLGPAKKQTPIMSSGYQDSSVERLIREVTNEKFWHHPGMPFYFFLILHYCIGLDSLVT